MAEGSGKALAFSQAADIIKNISQLYDYVKRFDTEFAAGKPVHRSLRNKNGTPKVFYHGARSKNGFNYYTIKFTGVKNNAKNIKNRVTAARLKLNHPLIAPRSPRYDDIRSRRPGHKTARYSPHIG